MLGSILIATLVAAVSCTVTGTSDIEIISKSLGAPPCMRTCIDPFMKTLNEMSGLSELIDQIEPICKAHKDAQDCLKKQPFCDIHGVFNIASKSLSHRCDRMDMVFKSMEPCLKENNEAIGQICDERCLGRANLTAFLENPQVKLASQIGGNIFMVGDHVSELCSSLSCLLTCTTEEFNTACPSAGWVILDTLLQPLEAIGQLMGTIPPALQDAVRTKLGKSCHFLLDTTTFEKLRHGDLDVIKAN